MMQTILLYLAIFSGVATITSCMGVFLAQLYPHDERDHHTLKLFFKKSRALTLMFISSLLASVVILLIMKFNDEGIIKDGNAHIARLVDDSTTFEIREQNFKDCLEQTQTKLQNSLDSSKAFDQDIAVRVSYCIDYIDKEVTHCTYTIEQLKNNDTIINQISPLFEAQKELLKHNSAITRKSILTTKTSLKLVSKQLHIILQRAQDLDIQNSKKVLLENELKLKKIAES